LLGDSISLAVKGVKAEGEFKGTIAIRSEPKADRVA